jgi:hypothetical protein
MATNAEKHQWSQLPAPWRHGGIFRNINNDLLIARQIGFVFDQITDNWYIKIDGRRYDGFDSTVSDKEWGDPYRLLGDMIPENDATFVFNYIGQGIKTNGSYEIRLDPDGSEYYFNEVGQKIYTYQIGTNPQADALINRPLTNRSDLLDDPNEIIFDILGNKIAAKTPEVGLYQSLQYFEELKAKKDQYREFYKTKDKAILLKRAKDIIKQEDELVSYLNGSGVAVKREKIFNATIGLVLVGAGIASSIVGGGIIFPKVVALAGSQITAPVARRTELRLQDLGGLDDELKALDAFINKKSSDVGTTATGLTTAQKIGIVLSIVLVGGLILLYFKNRRSF